MFVAGFIGEPPMNFIRTTVQNGCVKLGETTYDLTARYGDRIAAYEGKDVQFGFRPEAAVLGAQPNACVMKAKVELTEMLGDNTNVYIILGDKNAILKVDPHDEPEADTEITFSIPQESIYLFDCETEKVIR